MNPARILIATGAVLLGLGLVWAALSRLGVSLGRLPGDINYRGERVSVSLPLMTCLLLSALLTAIGWAASRWRGH